MQGLLDWLGYAYTHSGVLASALAMDKTRAKDAFRAAGLPVLCWTVRSAAEEAEARAVAQNITFEGYLP